MKKYFTRENRFALSAIISSIFMLYLAITSCLASDTGWVVLLYAALCWVGGFNTCGYVLPLIKRLIAQHRSKPTADNQFSKRRNYYE